LVKRFTGISISGVYQTLDKEMMLKTGKSFSWNLKIFPTHGTWYLISRALVFKVTFKTFEAEGMKTRQ